MADRTTGNQAVCRNQVTAAAASNATMSWMSHKRPTEAWAKAATPRGVKGSQAGGSVWTVVLIT